MKNLLLAVFVGAFFGVWAQPTPLRVIIFLSPECPLCQNYSLPLSVLQKKYAGKVEFMGVVPGKAYSAADVKGFVAKYHIGFPVSIDSSRAVTSSLKATVTPEVFLLVANKKVVYHGSIDNWIKDLGMQSARPTAFYLRDAIDQSLAHQTVAVPYNKPVGCLINDY